MKQYKPPVNTLTADVMFEALDEELYTRVMTLYTKQMLLNAVRGRRSDEEREALHKRHPIYQAIADEVNALIKEKFAL